MAKILIVDDEEDIRVSLKNILESHGYQVAEAKNGEDCLFQLQKEEFDLVLMDILLPGISGTETFKRLVKDKKIKKPKVIFISVIHYGIDAREKFEKLGVVDYITKPFNLKYLLAKVKEVLG